MSDSLGDRMKKNYENRARLYLTRRTPVIIRVDGKAFHTYTKRFDRPFDPRVEYAMDCAAQEILMNAQGCKLAYRQSDEISFLLTDWDKLDTSAWFDYNVQKLCSVAASMATMAFNGGMLSGGKFKSGETIPINAMFDARTFNIPREEITNYFLWRAKDWYRNSVTMYTQTFFSHTQLHGQSVANMHDMLHSIGKNWRHDLTMAQKNGRFWYRRTGTPVPVSEDNLPPKYEFVDKLVQDLMPVTLNTVGAETGRTECKS